MKLFTKSRGKMIYLFNIVKEPKSTDLNFESWNVEDLLISLGNQSGLECVDSNIFKYEEYCLNL